MTYLLILLAAAVAIGLVYLARLSGEYQVCRSLDMQVGPGVAFDKVRDFRSWKEWSPWLMHEPDTRLEFSDRCDQEGGNYTWDGRYIGAGKLTHQRFVNQERIEQRIAFTRPFKAVASVWWDFDERDDGTEVTWCMRGKMPFLFRFMTDTTRRMIEKDYALGLAMLRGVLDPKAEHPQIVFHGAVEVPAQHALTIPYKGGMDGMLDAMEAGFPKLVDYTTTIDATPTGPPFTAHHKMNLKTMYIECDMALPVPDGAAVAEFDARRLGGGRYFKVTLAGKYDYLELAWHSVMSHLRMRKIKQDSSRPSLEVYENGLRATVDSNDIRTTLLVPVR